MKFAVVEYTSKSGTIWRHAAQRPNYIADPKTEIDPTSFGCYVSALAGEHIPLKGLIVGPVNPVATPTAVYRKLVKRLTGSWSRYDINYLLQFDALLIVHQLSDAHEMVHLLQRIQRQRKGRRPALIGVPTQPYGTLRETVEADITARENLIDFINNCDVFISVVQSTVGWYEGLAKKPVRYMPQPYPVEYTSRFWQPRSDKEKTLLVAGVTQRENIIQGQIVARQLQKIFPEYSILIPKVDEYDYDFSQLNNSRYTVLPFEAWQQHLQTLSRTMLVINTDYTQTRGRVQTDCAAVGTPSLGGNSDGSVDLFPELVSEPQTTTETLINLGEKLLSDEAYYTNVMTHARQALEKYAYPASAARFEELLKNIDTISSIR